MSKKRKNAPAATPPAAAASDGPPLTSEALEMFVDAAAATGLMAALAELREPHPPEWAPVASGTPVTADTRAPRIEHVAVPFDPHRRFVLYPEERHWWSFRDYAFVCDLVLWLGATHVLEFGPGSSTLALVEGGATHIDTLENDPHWAQVYRDRLVPRFPDRVKLHTYTTGAPLPPAIVGPYHLALIDGPVDLEARLRVFDLCILNNLATVVAVPIDASDDMSARLEELAGVAGFSVKVYETGPLAGAFAVVTRRC